MTYDRDRQLIWPISLKPIFNELRTTSCTSCIRHVFVNSITESLKCCFLHLKIFTCTILHNIFKVNAFVSHHIPEKTVQLIQTGLLLCMMHQRSLCVIYRNVHARPHLCSEKVSLHLEALGARFRRLRYLYWL